MNNGEINGIRRIFELALVECFDLADSVHG